MSRDRNPTASRRLNFSGYQVAVWVWVGGKGGAVVSINNLTSCDETKSRTKVKFLKLNCSSPYMLSRPFYTGTYAGMCVSVKHIL